MLMKIDVWNDFCVPHCYTGERLLVRAIGEMDLEDKIDIRLRAFELDPGFPKGKTIDIPQCVAKKYGCTMAEALEKIDYAASMARAAGIDMKFRTAVFSNTRDAHRLLKSVEREHGDGMALQLNFALFDAYFTRNLVLDDENLVKIAAETGLNAKNAQKVLASDEYLQDVLADEHEAAARGIYAIPYFDFGGKFAINGATTLAGFRQAILKMMDDNGEKR